MKFEERDKPLIKNINSNLIRAERTEEDVSRLEYLTKVVNDASFFSLVLKNRGDLKHSMEYIETAMNVNRVITNILQRAHDLSFTLYHKEKEEG